MDNQLRDQLTTVTLEFFRLFEERDIDKWIELWSADGVDIKPYASGMFPEKVIGKDSIYDLWKSFPEVFDSVSFPIHEFIVDEESRTVVARLDGKGLMKNGTLYQNTYIFLFHYDKKFKIKECYEYFNPLIAGKAFGKLDELKY